MTTAADERNRDIVEFSVTIARELPDQAPGHLTAVLAELCSISRKLQRSNEAACNYGQSPRQQKRADNLTAKAAELAKSIGCGMVANGDPRGYPLFLTVPSGKTTDWGERGIGVPC